MPIERVRGDSPWEEAIGFAGAVAAGDRVLVAGTMPMADGHPPAPADPYEQARSALVNAVAALKPFGLGAESVIRTRLYVVHARDVDDVARAHKEVFGTIRPAATLLVVSGFVDSRVLVEVELEAYRDPSASPDAAELGTGPSRSTEGAP
ncbi:Rid family hydrolase [Streptomyces sp. ACA25]|uniref:Rid family hydrolase n=1 Tax=Streptomyces sp. ACA25 TaxID=3022596 RepID=UPI002307DEFA|nr:Rid family hydrolase [Streptomyces sp. ACA25]MDB1088640.1 Rid family hydrolase [Streptomyces sp. ACA25]